jgi:hypothetical protein
MNGWCSASFHAFATQVHKVAFEQIKFIYVIVVGVEFKV